MHVREGESDSRGRSCGPRCPTRVRYVRDGVTGSTTGLRHATSAARVRANDCSTVLLRAAASSAARVRAAASSTAVCALASCAAEAAGAPLARRQGLNVDHLDVGDWLDHELSDAIAATDGDHLIAVVDE